MLWSSKLGTEWHLDFVFKSFASTANTCLSKGCRMQVHGEITFGNIKNIVFFWPNLEALHEVIWPLPFVCHGAELSNSEWFIAFNFHKNQIVAGSNDFGRRSACVWYDLKLCSWLVSFSGSLQWFCICLAWMLTVFLLSPVNDATLLVSTNCCISWCADKRLSFLLPNDFYFKHVVGIWWPVRYRIWMASKWNSMRMRTFGTDLHFFGDTVWIFCRSQVLQNVWLHGFLDARLFFEPSQIWSVRDENHLK